MSKVCSLISKKSPNCESGLVRILKASKTPKTLRHYLRSLRIRPVPQAMQCRPEGSGGLTIAHDQGPFCVAITSKNTCTVPSILCIYLDIYIYTHRNDTCLHHTCFICTNWPASWAGYQDDFVWMNGYRLRRLLTFIVTQPKLVRCYQPRWEGMISWRALQSHKSVAVSAVFLLYIDLCCLHPEFLIFSRSAR